MPRSTWIFAVVLSTAVIIAIGLLEIRTSSQARARAETAAEAARAELSKLTAENERAATELKATQIRVNELEQAMQQAERTQTSMAAQMRAELESRDVTISELQGKLTVNILDHVLFDSGQARLKPGGEAVLRQVAKVLTQFTNHAVQIVGHTDNVPIRGKTPEGFTDNWGLSAGRAVVAVRYLVEHAGMDSRRLSAVGCGEFHPVASNSTAEGRAKNRRIAVVVLPEELALPGTSNAITNGVPSSPSESASANPEVLPAKE